MQRNREMPLGCLRWAVGNLHRTIYHSCAKASWAEGTSMGPKQCLLLWGICYFGSSSQQLPNSTVILIWASVRCCCYCWLRALPSLLDQLQQNDSLSTTFFLVNLVINSCPVWAKPVGEPWIASRILAARESRKHGCQLFSVCTNRIDLGKSDVEPAGITVSDPMKLPF